MNRTMMMTMTLILVTSEVSYAAPCWKTVESGKQLVECSQEQLQKAPLSYPLPNTPINSGSPSWCENPNKTKTEELICSSPVLSKLDNKLNQLYQSIPTEYKPRGLVNDRDDKCNEEIEKLQIWYQSAILKLEELGSQKGGRGIPWCFGSELSHAEKFICENQESFGLLDLQLNTAYRSRKNMEVENQRAWLKQRDEAALNGNLEEVKNLYQKRISQLQQ